MSLTVPQIRVLLVLREGASISRAELAERSGYTSLSGTITRAINGVKGDSSSGKPMKGLVDLQLVTTEQLVIEDGVTETVYTITTLGKELIEEYVESYGASAGPVRDKELSTNDRYRRDDVI